VTPCVAKQFGEGVILRTNLAAALRRLPSPDTVALQLVGVRVVVEIQFQKVHQTPLEIVLAVQILHYIEMFSDCNLLAAAAPAV
jgi:hypothetical protein